MKLPEAGAPICASGKHPFATEELAAAGLRSAQYLRHNSGPGYKPGSVEADVYQCRSCLWWHLSSSKRSQRRGYYANRARRSVRRR